jgi:hypothetical protein
MEVPAGSLEIELNLQAGDTEEELEKNYQKNLLLAEERAVKKQEIEALEKRKRQAELLETTENAAPVFA